MSNRTLPLDDALYTYLVDHSLRETPELIELRELTLQHRYANMQISPEQGQFMSLLVRLLKPQLVVEVGTFTGYSALCMAMALPADGKLICCDVSEEWTAIGRRFWRQAGVEERIELRLAPALDTLDALLGEGRSGCLDMAFIDADKANYENYYEKCLQLLRPGGLIMFDNTLWNGSVADPAISDEDTCALRALNSKLHADSRIDLSLVPIGDGLTLALKRQ